MAYDDYLLSRPAWSSALLMSTTWGALEAPATLIEHATEHYGHGGMMRAATKRMTIGADVADALIRGPRPHPFDPVRRMLPAALRFARCEDTLVAYGEFLLMLHPSTGGDSDLVEIIANPATSPTAAAGLLERRLNRPGRRGVCQTAAEVACAALTRRPDLPLATRRLNERVFVGARQGRHGLAVKVVQARRQAGLSATLKTLFPGSLDDEHASARAAAVIDACFAEPHPPDRDFIAHAVQVYVPDSLSAFNAVLDALRCDTLADGPYGQRPMFAAAVNRFAGRLQNLAGPVRDDLRACVVPALTAAAAPDPSADDLIRSVLSPGPVEVAAAARIVEEGRDRTVRDQKSGDPPLTRGLPWWPYSHEEAFQRSRSESWPLLTVARHGVMDGALFASWRPHAGQPMWVSESGNGATLRSQPLPVQFADARMRDELNWNERPTVGCFQHDANAARFAGAPPPDLALFEVDESRVHNPGEFGVLDHLPALLSQEIAGLPDRIAATTVLSSNRPGRALRALQAVA